MSQSVHAKHHAPVHHKEPVKSAHGAKKGKASAADHAMFLGMMALIDSIGESENIGVSIANMSKTLYDTLVKNGMNQIQDMQQELSSLSYLQKNWAAYKAYADWQNKLAWAHSHLHDGNWVDEMQAAAIIQQTSGHPPKVPDSSPSALKKYVGYVNQYHTLSSYRSYVNSFSQQINSENTTVENNKQIPDAMQNQVRTMVNDQGQYASEVSSFLRIMADQQQFS